MTDLQRCCTGLHYLVNLSSCDLDLTTTICDSNKNAYTHKLRSVSCLCVSECNRVWNHLKRSTLITTCYKRPLPCLPFNDSQSSAMLPKRVIFAGVQLLYEAVPTKGEREEWGRVGRREEWRRKAIYSKICMELCRRAHMHGMLMK